VLETGEPYRWERKTPDGCVINAYDFPLTDVDGSPLVLEMGIDITEQRRAEEDRVRLEEQLRQAHKMEAIGTLAGGIAHDFNNLLAVIIGNTELALDEVADEDNIRHNLMQIFKASKRGRDLVKQILQFSRKSDKQRKPTDIVPLVKETFRLLRSSIPASVEMKLDLLTDAAATFADPSEVQQILMNLGNNAEHAMREHGGTLAFGVEEKTYLPDDHVPVSDMDSGTYVVVSVRDTGAGMTAETRKRVFDPFFTTKEVGEGTGMGLATVFALVRDLNGEITVSSKLGKGSTFHIFLPKANTEKQDHDERHTDSLKGGKESILLVDDEEALTESNRAMLERLGYQVTATTDSKEALELFSGDPMRYDVVITDQAMPHITGIRLAEKMLKIRRDVRVILCTGYSHTASPEKAKTVGISEFLMKPITKKQLAAAVRRVLDGRHDR
jgi:signal transduction histidine kinase/CheY-like chemotaxis protein